MQNQQIQTREAGISLLDQWEQKKELASVLLKSGFLPQAFKTPEQVIAVMLKGQELNIQPMEALSSINVIQGKPTVSPQLMLALVRRTKELEDMKIERVNDSCTVTVKRKGQSPVVTVFGSKEATALGLMQKDNYKKQSGVMFQWRAVAANLRITFPDVICGMYTPEEMGAEVIVDDTENMVAVETQEAEIVETKPAPVSVASDVKVGKEFDPTKECIMRGKYEGVFYSELPADYLQWAVKNSSGELKIKAQATIRWREMQEQSQPTSADTVSEMLDKKPEIPLYDVLESELTEIALQQNHSKLMAWGKKRKDDIHTLTKKQQDIITKAWLKAAKDAKAAQEKVEEA